MPELELGDLLSGLNKAKPDRANQFLSPIAERTTTKELAGALAFQRAAAEAARGTQTQWIPAPRPNNIPGSLVYTTSPWAASAYPSLDYNTNIATTTYTTGSI